MLEVDALPPDALRLMPSLQAFLEAPTPRSPEALWNMEQTVYATAGRVADQILYTHLVKLHQDHDVVREAIQQVRSDSPVPLVHKGLRNVSVLLSGGTRVVLKTVMPP